MREKLIELIGHVQYLGGLELALADHLIANGVTIQKWIPVTERLPEKNENVLAWCDCVFMGVCYYTGYSWEMAWDNAEIYFITHWMPLPEAPNGERRSDAETD